MAEPAGQLGDGGRLEQQAERQLDRQLAADARDHLGGQQRMAAEREEVVVNADARPLQHLGPDLRERDLGRCAGCDVFGRRDAAAVRRRQRLAVGLAVGVQRQRVERHPGRRHHVGRQLGQQVGAQLGRRGVAGDVADQLRLAAVLAQQHGRLAHPFAAQQRALDLAEFDAQAAQLDLVVDAAEEQQRAVGLVAAEVAGAVHARARRAERIGHEAFGGQARPVQVAAGDAQAGDMDLAGHADRYRVLLGIEHVDAHVGQRFAQGRRDGAVGRQLRVADRHVGALGRAVGIDQGDVVRRQQLGQRGVDRLAAEHHAAQRGRQRLAGDEGAEGRRRAVDAGRPLLGQGLAEGVGIGGGAGRDDQGAAGQPGAEQVLLGQVEARRAGQQHALGVMSGIPERQVDEAGVGIDRALGRAGRARGVDAVGQVLRRGQRGRVIGRLPGDLVPVAIEAERPRMRRQAFGQRSLGQQHRRGGIGQHPGQPLGRVVGVERHVGGAGLEDAEDADGEVEAALDAQRDQAVGPHAEAAQVVGELVGARVERGIAQLPRAAGHGDRLGAAGGLGFEQLVDAARRPRGRVVVPAVEHPRAFGGVEQRQRADGGVRIGGDRFEQGTEVAGQPLDGRGIEQRGGVFVAQRQPVAGSPVAAAVVDFQLQVEGGMADAGRMAAGHPQRLFVLPLRRLRQFAVEVQHHLQVGRMAAVALWRGMLEDQLERQLALVVLEQAPGGIGQQRGEGGRAAEPGPQRHHVDEVADQPLGAGWPVGRQDAEAEIVLAAEPVQQRRHRGGQHHEQRGAAVAAQRRQPLDQRARQPVGPGRAGLVGIGLARPVGRQRQQGRRAGQRLAPPGQPLVEPVAAQMLRLPLHVVGVVDRQRRQPGRPAVARGGVERGQLVQQRPGRAAVVDDVVQREQQHLPVGGLPQQRGAQQRTGGEVEAALRLGGDLGLGGAGGVGQLAEFDHPQRDGQVRQHDLLRLAAVGLEYRAQRRMARHQRVERTLQRRGVDRAGQRQRQRDRVERVVRLVLVEEPEALLGMAQRQPRAVLAVDDRRQGGHGAALRRIDRLRQPGHGRRREQRAQRQFETEGLAQAADQLHRQQRMAAEAEEIVVHREVVAAEGGLPGGQQRAFGRRGRLARRLPGIGRPVGAPPSPDRLERAGGEQLAAAAALDLAARGARHLAGAHQQHGGQVGQLVTLGQLGADAGDQAVEPRLPAPFELLHDHQAGVLAVLDREGGAAVAAEGRIERLDADLDVLRVDVAAVEDHHFLAAAGDVEPVGVEETEVAGAQPAAVAAGQHGAEGLLALLRPAPVALRHRGALQPDLADAARGQLGAAGRVDDGDAVVDGAGRAGQHHLGAGFALGRLGAALGQRGGVEPARARRGAGRRGQVGRGHQHAFGHAVGGRHAVRRQTAASEGGGEALQRAGADALGAVDGDRQAGQVERRLLGLGHAFHAQLVGEVGRAGDAGAVAVDQPQPAVGPHQEGGRRELHAVAADPDRDHDRADQAEIVVRRQPGHEHVALGDAVGLPAQLGVGQQVGVADHHALGRAGRARGVLQEHDVGGLGRRRRPVLRRRRIVAVVAGDPAQSQQRVVAALAAAHGGQPGQQLGPRQRQRRRRVRRHQPQPRQRARIARRDRRYRDHAGVDTGIEGHHVVEAGRVDQQHAVARPGVALQPGGQRARRGVEAGVVERAADVLAVVEVAEGRRVGVARVGRGAVAHDVEQRGQGRVGQGHGDAYREVTFGGVRPGRPGRRPRGARARPAGPRTPGRRWAG